MPLVSSYGGSPFERKLKFFLQEGKRPSGHARRSSGAIRAVTRRVACA